MGWPLPQGVIAETAGAVTSGSFGTTITVTTADTLGAWVQLIAATAHEWNGFILSGKMLNSAVDGHLKISIGAAGSETSHIIVDSLAFGATGGGPNYHAFIPVRVPKGARIAAAMQVSDSADTFEMLINGYTGTFNGQPGFRRAVGYGVQTAGPSGGTQTVLGANNVKGAWAQITGSTARDIAGIIIASNWIANHATGLRALVDVAVGAAASERIILPNLKYNGSTSNDCGDPFWSQFHPVFIPVGSRIAMRGQCHHTATQDNGFSILGLEP